MTNSSNSDSENPGKPIHPWPWQHHKKKTVAIVKSPKNQCWIRVTHHSGEQKLVPWPAFKDWEKTLPPECGTPDFVLQAYSVPDIVIALKTLRHMGYSSPIVTSWPRVLGHLPPA